MQGGGEFPKTPGTGRGNRKISYKAGGRGLEIYGSRGGVL